MIDLDDYKKKLRKATSENIKSILIFLENDEAITYDQIAKVIGKENEDQGRAVGGILSALSRTTFDGEPFIIPMGREKDTRRLLWRINKKVVPTERIREKLVGIIRDVLRERE